MARGAHHGQTVRTERWRYIHWCDGHAELYDHEQDPEEMHNLADQPEHGVLLKNLGALLMKRVGTDPPGEGTTSR